MLEEQRQKISFPIYLDNHATTPVDRRVLKEMLPYFTEIYGNTASTDHSYGSNANRAVENARDQVANVINCKAEEIIFTSGATESDNLALQGIAEKYKEKGNHIITCTTEHKAILDTCKQLEKMGKEITYLPVDRYGKIDLELLESSIIPNKTIMISIMAANNEIGTIADTKEIGSVAHKHDILFHTDAAQAVGHIPIDVEKMNIDLLSLSGHKVYGPKGIGALYCRGVRPRIRPHPIIFGGGHERGIRSGTLNVPGIVGLGKALDISSKEMDNERELFRRWTGMMLEMFLDGIGRDNVSLNGHPNDRLSHNLNVYLKGIENKALINQIQTEISISAGSACTTTLMEPSHVIMALGYPEERAYCSIRIGLGRQNTEGEVKYATMKIVNAANKLKKIGQS
jgi:cysteine desulfurase